MYPPPALCPPSLFLRGFLMLAWDTQLVHLGFRHTTNYHGLVDDNNNNNNNNNNNHPIEVTALFVFPWFTWVVMLQTDIRKLPYKIQPYLLHYCKTPIDPLVYEYAGPGLPEACGNFHFSFPFSHTFQYNTGFTGRCLGGGWNPTTFGKLFFPHFFLKLPTLRPGFFGCCVSLKILTPKKLWKYQTLLVTLKDS